MNNNYKKKINRREKNIGIEILRIYLSILVVNSHCYKISNNLIFIKILKNNLHVPTFFIISFFFFKNSLVARNLNKFKQRFQRLLIPYITWPIINWSINNIITFFTNINLRKSIEDLKKLFLTGHCFNTVFWFQWNLIFETFIFIIVELIWHEYLIYILMNLVLSSYFLQYSNYNYRLFYKLDFSKRFTFGRFIEIIPFSISIFILSYYQLINFLKDDKMKTIFICLFIFVIIFNYIIILEPKGFLYAGIKLNILSICLFIVFSLISFKFMNNFKMILQISKFTPGIYYLHIPIMKYFINFITTIKNKQLFGSFLIYLICYFICFIGSNIFKNSKLIYLFE